MPIAVLMSADLTAGFPSRGRGHKCLGGALGAQAPRSHDSLGSAGRTRRVQPMGSTAQGRLRRALPRRRTALRLVLAAIIALPLAAARLLPAAAGSNTPTWPDGMV